MYPESDNEEMNGISTDVTEESCVEAISPECESSSAPEEIAPLDNLADEPTMDATVFEEDAVAPIEEPTISQEKSENFINYGRDDAPDGVNYAETLAFLTERLKYDGGALRQARQNKDGSGVIVVENDATEFCSYCGLPISGVDHYRLPDGRKRCTNCNRSLVKSVEELNSIFNDVLINMELFFGATIDVPISVEMLEERKLKKKVRKGLGDPPKNVLILGVAVEHKGKYTVYIENGIPRASLIATLAHELTHIWQYTHWNAKNIRKTYGPKMRLPVYEGMAMWTEIQYLYHIGEHAIAERDEILTLARKDEYGVGFALYIDQYPLKKETKAFIDPPFSAGETPLSI